MPVNDITVAVLDSHDLLCDGLEALVRRTPGLECVGAWTGATDAISALPQANPHILLLDLQLPGRSALDLLEQLPALSPRTRAIVMVDCPEDHCIVLNPRRCCDHCRSQSASCQAPGRAKAASLGVTDDCLQTALKMGALGAMQKRRHFTHILEVVQAVHAGRHWMELPTTRRLAHQYIGSFPSAARPSASRSRVEALTAREREVAALIAQGRSNREICQELELGYSTVKNYVSSILEKLGLRDRTQIALYAMEQASDSASSTIEISDHGRVYNERGRGINTASLGQADAPVGRERT